jgi:hypothetical protein
MLAVHLELPENLQLEINDDMNEPNVELGRELIHKLHIQREVHNISPDIADSNNQ